MPAVHPMCSRVHGRAPRASARTEPGAETGLFQHSRERVAPFRTTQRTRSTSTATDWHTLPIARGTPRSAAPEVPSRESDGKTGPAWVGKIGRSVAPLQKQRGGPGNPWKSVRVAACQRGTDRAAHGCQSPRMRSLCPRGCTPRVGAGLRKRARSAARSASRRPSGRCGPHRCPECGSGRDRAGRSRPPSRPPQHRRGRTSPPSD